MINYKEEGFNTLNEMFDDMLKKQAEGDHVGFIKMSSKLTKNQKVAFIEHSKGHEVFAGAMKDLVTESCGDYRVGKDYADYIKYALSQGGYIVTNKPEDGLCCSDNWAYPEVYFTDGQLIEGYVSLFQKEVHLKAVDAKERVYNKSITYLDEQDLIESIDHFKNDIEETFNETVTPDISMEAPVEKKADGNDVDWAKNELALFIENDAQLDYQQITPILKNLARKKQKGVYDPELAVKLWKYCVDNGYKKYRQEVDNTFKLSPADRTEVAQKLRDDYDHNVDEWVNTLFGPQDEKEAQADAELDKAAEAGGDVTTLSQYLQVDPAEVTTEDGENYFVNGKTETYKVSDKALDLAEQGYQNAMHDNKYIYWK